MSEVTTNQAVGLLWLAIALSAVAIAVSVFALYRLAAALKPFARVRDHSDDPSRVLPAVLRTVEELDVTVGDLKTGLTEHLEQSRAFIRHIGLVRYDAFQDVGGKQSFSLCLLDAERSGMLLTYLTGRNSTRSYAVTIERGLAERKLSEEEAKSLQEATKGPEPVTVP